MINLGLSSADQAAFEATLLRSHRIATNVRIHDRDERIIHTFTGAILSGAVQVDMSQTTSNLGFAKGADNTSGGAIRTLDLTVLLPRKDQAWLPDQPSTEAAFADNFISVEYGVWVDGLTAGPGWVWVPVFWGPITGLSRDGDQVNIQGSGKEVLGLDPVLLWHPLTIKKGTYRTTAIRRVMEAMGERRFDFPNYTSKLINTWSLPRGAQAWVTASSIARHGNWQLFYDGRGRLRLRPYPQNRLWLFKSGDDGTVLSKPKVSYDIDSSRNVVEVEGSPPSGKAKQIRTESRPPADHPLSPWSLRRNGVRRNMVHREEGAQVNNKREAQALGDRILNQLITVNVQIEFESLPIPHLEEGDRLAVIVGETYATGPPRVLEGQHIEFSLLKFTIPLTADSPMSVGVNRRVSFRRRGLAPINRWTR